MNRPAKTWTCRKCGFVQPKADDGAKVCGSVACVRLRTSAPVRKPRSSRALGGNH